MRLESLTINKFRHVKPCTLEFADDLSVVLGKNGAGKTTLLKLIAAVCKLDFSEFKEELSVDAVFQFAAWKISVAINQPKAEKEQLPTRERKPPAQASGITMFAKITLSETLKVHSEWARLGPTQQKNSGGVEPSDVSNSLFVQLWDTLSRVVSTRSTFPDSFFDLMAAWAIVSLELFRFDESLGFFDQVTGKNDSPKERATIKLAGAALRQLVPSDLLAAWQLPPSGPRRFAVEATNKESPLLNRWAKLLGWETLTAAIRLEEESQGVATYSSISFLATTDARTVRNEHFSYGQKRFLSFLYYAACQEHLLLVDELANGLHHEWIEICFAEMKGKQTIMSSQNPLIFDHLEFSDAAAVSKALILCSQNEQGEMVWENMHAESAAHFFTSYERGIRQVSEILREQKLW